MGDINKIMDKNKITKIEVQKRNKDRVNVYVDNDFLFSCDIEIVYKNNLKVGNIVDAESIKEIASEDNYIKAKNYILKVIEKNYKTDKEIYDKLKIKGYEDNIIQRVQHFLHTYQFTDDSKYANMYIKEKMRKNGKRKIYYSLIQKGVSEEIIEDGLANISDEDEVDSALELAKRKYKSLTRLESDSRKVYNKLCSYLLRRGYKYENIKKVVSQIVNEEYIDEY